MSLAVTYEVPNLAFELKVGAGYCFYVDKLTYNRFAEAADYAVSISLYNARFFRDIQ